MLRPLFADREAICAALCGDIWQTDAVAAGKTQCDQFTKEESLAMAGIVDEILSQLGVSYPPEATDPA